MTTTLTTADLQVAFTFPFKDPRWISKFAIGTLIYTFGILFIPGFIVSGYYYEIARRIIQERAAPALPEWTDLGAYLANGLKMALVSLIYLLPVWLSFLPAAVMALLTNLEQTINLSAEFYLVGMLLSFGVMMLGMGLGIPLGIFNQAATNHMIAKGEFRAAFRVREWWSILRYNVLGFVLAAFLIKGAFYILMLIQQFIFMTIILCIIYPVFMFGVYFYIGIVGSVLHAQAYVGGADRAALLQAQPHLSASPVPADSGN